MKDRPAKLERPWSRAAQQVTEALGVDPDRGLDAAAVHERRARYGPNRLREARRRSAWRILFDQFTSLIVAMLAAASVAAFVLVDWLDGTAIAVVIVINALLGFFTELKAVRSMEALYRLGQVTARVRRDGRVAEIPAAELVPGDIVVVEGGDVVTADLRLIQASKLQANEAALTGESAPVGKSVEPVPEGTVLPERASMLYKGTTLTRGSGEGVAVATGLETELGRITSLVEETETGETPLERRLERLGRRLVVVTLGLALVVGALGVFAGRELVVMLETAIALAVATVPEGLPVVATIALARGMWRMARQNALINRLSAVETLGATGVICTDKTGTLTENRMSVARLRLADGEFVRGKDGGGDWSFERDGQAVDVDAEPALREALETGLLCNNADFDEKADPDGEHAVGDPVEVALLAAALRSGIRREALLQEQPEERQEAFDPETKMMATFHRREGGVRLAVKGAPEAVIEACTHVRTGEGSRELGQDGRGGWLERNAAMARDGLRVLALATRVADSATGHPYADLVLLGLVGLVDPPRNDVRDAIARCQSAGIRVVMVTGDQAATAAYVARAVGLIGDGEPEVLPGSAIGPLEALTDEQRRRLVGATLFARVEPAQKLGLIALHQQAGNVVAMTGDGVNDAPALKKADIGIAMGRRGTQAAREAAAMVLKDDAFRTILVAVEQGRIIFDNIRKFVLYLLSCNVSELLVVALATAASAPLPILPLQILFLNIVTDVFPALALGVGAGDPDVMQRKPRPSDESILTRNHWIAVAVYGAVITVAVLGAFAAGLLWLEVGEGAAVTVSFLTLALAQLWHVFNMRDADAGLLRNDVVRNPWVWGALLLCLLLIAAAVFMPSLADVLGVVPLRGPAWALVVGCSLVPLLVGQVSLALLRGSRATPGRPTVRA
jgi:Ca2+-transporting ATPase